MLCLDDLHWADRSTLSLFQHLARKLASARLCVVATYRTVGVEADHPLFSILADLGRERLYHSLGVPPFSSGETAAFIAALSGQDVLPATLIEAVHERTRGNPFFIEEVVRHLRASGRQLHEPGLVAGEWGTSEGVRQVIGSRLARLSPEVRRLLQASAVLGDDFTELFPCIAHMLEADVASLATAVEVAVTSGLLREDGERYRFAHALIRDALLDELPLARRQALHLRAAEAMEHVYSRNLEPWYASIAVHYRLAGPFAEVSTTIDYSVLAGEAAERLLAYEEAEAH